MTARTKPASEAEPKVLPEPRRDGQSADDDFWREKWTHRIAVMHREELESLLRHFDRRGASRGALRESHTIGRQVVRERLAELDRRKRHRALAERKPQESPHSRKLS
ncbi:hypothetical protein LVJ94_34755 [Pendulispora rubella]|uniref:Uncharacterized protein n=1 Tax=Pendulispora rubella TaxID=2741070 RepID=A0ABZ2KTP5_9BACT